MLNLPARILEYDHLKLMREQGQNDYNHHRPHSGLGWLTPSEFTKTATSAQAKAMDAALLDVYAPMAFAQPAQQGIINRRSELKTG
jgi:putative transposase